MSFTNSRRCPFNNQKININKPPLPVHCHTVNVPPFKRHQSYRWSVVRRNVMVKPDKVLCIIIVFNHILMTITVYKIASKKIVKLNAPR